MTPMGNTRVRYPPPPPWMVNGEGVRIGRVAVEDSAVVALLPKPASSAYRYLLILISSSLFGRYSSSTRHLVSGSMLMPSLFVLSRVLSVCCVLFVSLESTSTYAWV